MLATPNRLRFSTLKAAASSTSAYKGHRHVYRNINHTGSGTSINVFSFFTSIAWLENGEFGRPYLRVYKVMFFSILTQHRVWLNLPTNIKN